MGAPGELLLLVLLLLAAAMAGAFARLLRLPAVPVQVLFGLLLAHGPSAAVDARAALVLQPAAVVALCVAALVTGLRLTAPAGSFARERPPVLRHLLAELAFVPGLVWVALVTVGRLPPQPALLLGLLALGSVGEVIVALARRAGAERLAGGLLAVARADLAASLALALVAVFAWRLRFDPPALSHGVELPFAACSLALGCCLGASASGLMGRLALPIARGYGFALAVCGTLAGASLSLDALPAGLLLASLAVSARLLGKLLAAAWSGRGLGGDAAQVASRGAGLALAPGGLLGVALLLVVRHDTALASGAELLLAAGAWIAVLQATLGPPLARVALARLAAAGAARAVSPASPPASADGTPPAR